MVDEEDDVGGWRLVLRYYCFLAIMMVVIRGLIFIICIQFYPVKKNISDLCGLEIVLFFYIYTVYK
ncbi:hypothetical protein HanIR_Chr03g0104331 [Helianthus annuus]|nr:hypothetical protein HanIR_Chr03g0104331 [Helianthus annuus]